MSFRAPICGASAARRGRIAIFDRSWYGRVLVERVEKLARRLASRLCRDQRLRGTTVGQRRAGAEILAGGHARRAARTLQEREKSPFKNFKITPDDWRNRDKWKNTPPPPTRC